MGEYLFPVEKVTSYFKVQIQKRSSKIYSTKISTRHTDYLVWLFENKNWRQVYSNG